MRALDTRMIDLAFLGVQPAGPRLLRSGADRAGGGRRRVVTLPAFLGPAQVLLFGPWTVHATNRSEFLAPRWIGLLGLVTGLLVAIGLLLPPRAGLLSPFPERR